MDLVFNFLSENPALAWVIVIATILLCIAIVWLIYVALTEGWNIQFWPPNISKQTRKSKGEADDRRCSPSGVENIPPPNHAWEPPLQESVDRFPEELKRILASNLAEKLRNQLDDPTVLLAVQESGQWLAEYLTYWLDPKPKIIMVEKDISPDRSGEYLEIRIRGVKERPSLFIVYKELGQNSGNMVIVDDFIDSGDTVWSIVEKLKERGNNIKAVATIAVTKINLDKLENYLRNDKAELLYLLTAEGGLP